MPTISGLRRRGYTPESIREFCDRVGIAKREILADMGLLEFCVREHLNKIALRRMVVFDPLKVVITNYAMTMDDGLRTIDDPTVVSGLSSVISNEEMLTSENNPEDANSGVRDIPFSN